MRKLDLNGWKSDEVEVLGFDHVRDSGQAMWKCRCLHCNTEFVAMGYRIFHKLTTSCGCQKKVRCSASMTQHGASGSSLYALWTGLIQRCENENCAKYENYGKRGITVCERWRNSFEAFAEDMGEKPEGCTLDRIDNDGPYSPENCRWADRETQGANKRNTVLLEHDGQSLTIQQWSKVCGISSAVIRRRYYTLKWSIADCLTKPLQEGRGKNKEVSARSPAAIAAHKLHVEVRTGRIKKPDHCEHPGCQETKITAHHHNGYEPEHWLDVTWLCKIHKPKHNDTMIEVNGVTKSLTEWSRESGIPKATISHRLKSSEWTTEDAVSVPVGVRKGGPRKARS